MGRAAFWPPSGGTAPGQRGKSWKGGRNMKIDLVDACRIEAAARVHAIAWRASHEAFCSPAFVASHTAERQQAYLQQKMAAGSRFYLLTLPKPAAVVSIAPGSVIEDLYVLPEEQNKGLGTQLLRFAIGQCTARPRLWVLENNNGAQRFYQRAGFRPTGRRRSTGRLDEVEFLLL